MAISDIDFGSSGNQTIVNEPEKGENPANTQEDIEALNGDDAEDVNKNDSTVDNTKEEKTDDNSSTGELTPGDIIELDGVKYTVDENGNILDEKGNIFKESKDVKEWIKSLDVEEDKDENELSLSSIQDYIGIEICDEDGNKVEFTNDANGVKSYIDSVINLKSTELQEAAVNKLYADNPILKEFQDYVQLTGSPRGFGELPDRSGITLDKENEAQLVAVIKMAANEFGNKSLNDNYIKYLRDTGGLFDEAKNQLSALVEKDKNIRKQIEIEAEKKRQEESKNLKEYWDNVTKAIKGKVISGYKLPDSFVKEVDGRKLTLTLDDFIEYVSKPSFTLEDGKTITGYMNDLNKLSDEDYLHREILDAWLLFKGGTYKDLIDMAVKEDKVKQLRFKSKEQRNNKSVKIFKTPSKKANINDIIL